MSKPIIKKKNIGKNSFDERVRNYIISVNKLAEELDLNVRPIVNFKKGKPSIFGKFAILLLRLSGGTLDTQFINTKK